MYIENDEFGEWMQKLYAKLEELCKDVRVLRNADKVLPEDDNLLDNQDLCLLFKVSIKTLQRYRAIAKCYSLSNWFTKWFCNMNSVLACYEMFAIYAFRKKPIHNYPFYPETASPSESCIETCSFVLDFLRASSFLARSAFLISVFFNFTSLKRL